MPEFTEGTRASRSVAENTAAGVDIGEPVTATDPDEDPLTYTLVGSARDVFGIDASSGQLRTKAPLDYETKDTHVLTVGVRDSKDSEGKPDRRRDDSIRVTINITNVDEDGWVTLSAPTPRVGTPLEAAVADPDGGIGDIVWLWEKSPDRSTWTPIEDTNRSVYTPADPDENHHLRVVATYSDGHGPNKTASVAADEAVTVGHTTSFADITPEGTHTPAITTLGTDGVFTDTECGPNLFCPNDPIQRWIMAVWLIRVLDQNSTTTGVSRPARLHETCGICEIPPEPALISPLVAYSGLWVPSSASPPPPAPELEADPGMGDPVRHVPSVAGAVEAFFASWDLVSGTRRTYRQTLDPLVEAAAGDRAVTDLAPELVAALVSERWGSTSLATWNTRRVAIQAFASWCQERWPLAGVEPRRRVADNTRAIPLDDLEELLRQPSVPLREKTLWSMLYETAARASEVLALDVEDLDLSRRRARIRSKGGSIDMVRWAAPTARLLGRCS